MNTSSNSNKAQNSAPNNIFDTLGDVFAKSTSPNSKINYNK